jgi:5-(carboxyamino)imidazole ribonucleotide mutase
VSAHHAPKAGGPGGEPAASRASGFRVAGSAGAAHLPGMTASLTLLPVLGVPVETAALKGMDSLYSIVQMPGGVPVATFAIGKAGAINAGLFAASILAESDFKIGRALSARRSAQTKRVLRSRLP